MYHRMQKLSLSSQETCFLLGPRQTGKSTLLKRLFPEAMRYDLLLSTEYQRLLQEPKLIREQSLAAGLDGDSQSDPIIIDEIQKIPGLLNEIHWLIENRGLRFILCGSSARKLKRGQANLLGGRAVRYEMHPLVSPEIPDFGRHADRQAVTRFSKKEKTAAGEQSQILLFRPISVNPPIPPGSGSARI